jgi:CheY-like chemotaxis protein
LTTQVATTLLSFRGVNASWRDSEVSRPGDDSYGEPLLGTSVLLVEDDDGVRQMLTLALEEEGFLVTPVASAEQGLTWLRKCEFDAVLTDYALPGGDGAWMLEEAARSGRLADTPAFIVTGHHDLPIPGRFAVIPKPLDLDGLLQEVRRAVDAIATDGRRRTGPRQDRRVRSHDSAAGRDRARNKTAIELVLYVSAQSVHSAAALRNIRQVLAQFDGQVKLTVHDLSKEPQRGEADGVHFTPALLSRGPGPRTWIVGHLQNPQVIQAILDAASERDH